MLIGVLCVLVTLNMPDKVNKVHFLKSVKMLKGDGDDLLMLSISGYSLDEGAGVPVLRMREQEGGKSKNGILEFDFLVKPVDIVKKTSVEFNLDVVFNLNLLPGHLKGIKVTAENNADIILV